MSHGLNCRFPLLPRSNYVSNASLPGKVKLSRGLFSLESGIAPVQFTGPPF